MDGTRELRRMLRGESCPECGSHKWYLQDGLRFCSRGHQIEGFIQFDVGDEEDSGKLGAVARRERVSREKRKQAPILTGQAGRDLYLEALQLILRIQIQWLINEKGYRSELETVVRDLWSLRIRGSKLTVIDETLEGEELELFSSQPLQEENHLIWRPYSSRQSWDPDFGLRWPLPRVSDNLAIIYLGCVVLRIPARVGELSRWANEGNMPYKRSYYDLPHEMRDRIPAPYTRALKMPLRALPEEDGLFRQITGFIVSFNLNYEMVIPDINYIPILVQYAHLLALPVESVVVVKLLSAILDCRFSFPSKDSANLRLSHPEIQLVALLVVATKLCFPFKGKGAMLRASASVKLPDFDWAKWQEQKIKSPEERGFNFDDFTPGEVASLSNDEFNAYLAHVSSPINFTGDNPITQFFPKEGFSTIEKSSNLSSVEETEKAAQDLLRLVLGPPDDGSSHELQQPYETFRSVEHLSNAAAIFYQAAGDMAGISLATLVAAVYRIERAMVLWQKAH